MFDDICPSFFVGRMFWFRSHIFSNIQQMLKRVAALSTMLFCKDLVQQNPNKFISLALICFKYRFTCIVGRQITPVRRKHPTCWERFANSCSCYTGHEGCASGNYSIDKPCLGISNAGFTTNPHYQVKLWSSQLWTQFLQLRKEAWKIQDFNGVWTCDLQPRWSPDSFRLLYAIAKIAFITVRIIASLDFISAVHIWSISYIISSLNPHYLAFSRGMDSTEKQSRIVRFAWGERSPRASLALPCTYLKTPKHSTSCTGYFKHTSTCKRPIYTDQLFTLLSL